MVVVIPHISETMQVIVDDGVTKRFSTQGKEQWGGREGVACVKTFIGSCLFYL